MYFAVLIILEHKWIRDLLTQLGILCFYDDLSELLDRFNLA